MNNRTHTTRRAFLKTAGVAVAAPYVITTAALGNADQPPASERIVVGGIGIGNMGAGDLNGFLHRGDTQYVAVCDVSTEHRDAAKATVDGRNKNTDCAAYNDFRELLGRSDIDAVHIATPDHWHAIIAIEACRNGKDVYCQKPESRTLREGRLMVEAARRYNRVFTGGSQRVLEDYRKIVDPCWDGTAGAIKWINVNVGPLSLPCNPPPADAVPAGLDWDMWLGPAPWAPFHPFRISGSYNINGECWRSFSDYSGGGMTDWGAHHFGGALFAVDVRELQPTEIEYHDENGAQYLAFKFPTGVTVYHNKPNTENLAYEGTPGEKRAPKTVPDYKGEKNKEGRGSIYNDFLYCVKNREKPFRDIELAVNTAAVCHLGAIAYDLRRSLKWDAAKQEFPGDEEANRFIDRARRQPWQL